MKVVAAIMMILSLMMVTWLSSGARTNSTDLTGVQSELSTSKNVNGPIQSDGLPYPKVDGFAPVGLNHTTLELWPGLRNVAAGVIDPTGGFAYFASGSSQGVLVKIRLSDFSRVHAIVLEIPNVDSAVIDAAAGFGYFGASSGVMKVSLADLIQVDRLTIHGGQLKAAAIDTAAGYAYFGSDSRLTRVRLSDFSAAGTIDLQSKETFNNQALIDPANGYVYFVASELDVSNLVGRIIKVRLSDFTRINHLDLTGGFNASSAAIDLSGGHIFVGTSSGTVKVSLATFSVVDETTEVASATGDSIVIDPGSGFGYFTSTSPTQVIQVRLSDLEKVKEIGLERDETFLKTGLVDPGEGYAYFATSEPSHQSKVVKIDLSNHSRVGALKLSAGEDYLSSSVVDHQNGYAYFGSSGHFVGVITKIHLSDFTRVGALTLPNPLFNLYSAVVDTAGGYAYFGTGTGKIVKIRLSDFSFIDSLSLTKFGTSGIGSAVIDPAAGYAYFGASALGFGTTDPIYKVRLSDFSLVDTLTLESGEKALEAAVIDPSKGYAYFGTETDPGKVIRVRLSDFTRDGVITLGAGEGFIRAAAIDIKAGFAYFTTNTHWIVKIRLSDFTRVDALSYGERPIESAVIDPDSGLAYFGTGSLPGRILTVRLSDFSGVKTDILDKGEDLLRSAVIDPTTGIPYFGAYSLPGKVFKYAQSTMEYETYIPLVMR